MENELHDFIRNINIVIKLILIIQRYNISKHMSITSKGDLYCKKYFTSIIFFPRHHISSCLICYLFQESKAFIYPNQP